jgi:hypothetical protein
MKELAAAARSPGKVYFTGGATALLLGFREQTIDIDLKLDPEPAGAFEAIAALKDRLQLNVKLASPADFIPATDDWRERSRPVASIGCVEFFHYDISWPMNRKPHHASLPGEDLVETGLADLAQGQVSDCSLLLSIAAPRLRRLGIPVPPVQNSECGVRNSGQPYEHQLYVRLEERLGAAAHSHYNSLIRRIVSYARSLERERSQG